MKYDFTGLMEDSPKTQSKKVDFTGLMDEKPKSKGTSASWKEKKDAWKISSPEELVEQGLNPIAAGLAATGQQLSRPLWQFGNAAMFGLPNVALDKMGYKVPSNVNEGDTPKQIMAKGGLDAIGGVAGFIRGPVAAGGAIAGRLPARTIAQAAGKGAVQYGIAAGLDTPDSPNPSESFGNWKARGLRTTGGAVGGAILGGLGKAADIYLKPMAKNAQLQVGREVRGEYDGLRTKLTDRFEKRMYELTVKNKGKTADIQPAVDSFLKEVGDSKKLKTLYNVSPKLQKLLGGDKRLSLKQTQELVNQLKSSVSEAKLAGRNVRPSDKEVLNFVNKIQNIKHSTFKGMKSVDAAYGRMSETANVVKTYMKQGKTVNGLKTIFKNPEQERALKSIMSPEMFEKAQNLVRSKNFSQAAVSTAQSLIRYGIIYWGMKNIAKGLNFGEGAEAEGGK
jgi:hypothetical protein